MAAVYPVPGIVKSSCFDFVFFFNVFFLSRIVRPVIRQEFATNNCSVGAIGQRIDFSRQKSAGDAS